MSGKLLRIIIWLAVSACILIGLMLPVMAYASGDDSKPFMYAMLMVLFAAAVIILLRKRRLA